MPQVPIVGTVGTMRTPLFPRVVVLLPLFAWSACGPKPDPVPPVTQTEESNPADATMPPMDQHFVQANDIKLAIVLGNLDDTRDPARWLQNNLDASALPVRWRPHIPKVKRAAKAVEEASTVEEAAAGAAALARACGECHSDVGIELGGPESYEPTDSNAPGEKMFLHQWAVDRMYEGLIRPSAESWTAGASKLADAPLHGEGPSEPVTGLAAKVHGLGASGKNATDWDQREDHLAALFSTCAGCHQAVGYEPAN